MAALGPEKVSGINDSWIALTIVAQNKLNVITRNLCVSTHTSRPVNDYSFNYDNKLIKALLCGASCLTFY